MKSNFLLQLTQVKKHTKVQGINSTCQISLEPITISSFLIDWQC